MLEAFPGHFRGAPHVHACDLAPVVIGGDDDVVAESLQDARLFENTHLLRKRTQIDISLSIFAVEVDKNRSDSFF